MEKEDSIYRYRYEAHCHTCWCSGCGRSSPQEMAQAYYDKGYAGMILTDHFLLGNSCVDRTLPWEEQMKRYHEAYQAAAQWAQGKEFDVLFGIEHCYGNGKEVLTYGIDLDFLVSHPGIHRLPLGDYAQLVHEAGGFLSMAHPYRDRPYINMAVGPQPEYLDAVEVFNFYNYPQENQRAVELARENKLLATSGGDEHRCDGEAVGMAGVALRRRVHTGAQLVQELRSGDYRVIANGKLAPCAYE